MEEEWVLLEKIETDLKVNLIITNYKSNIEKDDTLDI